MLAALTDTLNFNGQALILRAQRQQVIASNIANADTPGYQARDFDFAAALRDATGGAGLGGGIARDVMAGSAGSPSEPALKYVHPTQTSLDSNTVDMDRERSASLANSFSYEATLRFINDDVRNLTTAMKSFSQA
ncbi:MAG: flagellar basal body rod protein FlgB [Burkholderiales bacterium]|nr:flagellar basal body rod protein FlgB [Burkholderiales bacterium]MDE2566350.1 flagellar basal body rod protein FlgB [Burkholderiales bacterium]